MKIAELFEANRFGPSPRELRLRNSWAILPASRILFNKNKVSLSEIIKEWDHGTILICKRLTGSMREAPIVFLSSAGDMGVHVGFRKMAHHDQSFASLGEMEVVNVVHYKHGKSDKPEIQPANDQHLKDKAPVFVFK